MFRNQCGYSGQHWCEGTSLSSRIHDSQGRLKAACTGTNHMTISGYRNLKIKRGWDKGKNFEWPTEIKTMPGRSAENWFIWKARALPPISTHPPPHPELYTEMSESQHNTNLLVRFQITEGTVCIENGIIRETLNGSAVATDSFIPLLLLYEIISLEQM